MESSLLHSSKPLLERLELGRKDQALVLSMRRQVPKIFHYWQEIKEWDPIIFKPKNIWFWYQWLHLNHIWDMIWDRVGQCKCHSARKRIGLVRTSKHPVQLLKQSILLHITPCKSSVFQRYLNQIKMRDDVIEEHHFIYVPTRPVSVFRVPYRIKITQQ
jgi:hypothetical protein